MGTDFAHFNLESDMVYEGAIRECINVSLDLIPNKKERKSNMRIQMDLRKSSCWPSNLINDISAFARFQNGNSF